MPLLLHKDIFLKNCLKENHKSMISLIHGHRAVVADTLTFTELPPVTVTVILKRVLTLQCRLIGFLLKKILKIRPLSLALYANAPPAIPKRIIAVNKILAFFSVLIFKRRKCLLFIMIFVGPMSINIVMITVVFVPRQV